MELYDFESQPYYKVVLHASDIHGLTTTLPTIEIMTQRPYYSCHRPRNSLLYCRVEYTPVTYSFVGYDALETAGKEFSVPEDIVNRAIEDIKVAVSELTAQDLVDGTYIIVRDGALYELIQAIGIK